MKNFAFTALGGVLALVIFVLGMVFAEGIKTLQEPINKAKQAQNADQAPAQNLLKINDQITFSLDAKPDLYRSNPTFYAKNLTNEDKSLINARFSGILTLVKESTLCSGGAYQTFNERSNNGEYSLSLRSNLSCEFKEEELEKYNELIANIEQIIATSPVKLHLSKIEPSFSKEASTKIQAELKNGVMKKALELSTSLSSTFGKSCELESISLDSYMPRFAKAAVMLNDAASAPELKNEELETNAAVSYICK